MVRGMAIGLVTAMIAVLCAGTPADTNETVITADRLTFDYQRYIAVFEDNVVVSDPQIRMTASRLNVLFDKQDSVKSVTAIGGVQLEYDGKNGSCDKAIYIAKDAEILLVGNAELRRGRDAVMGEKIRFWLGEDRMLCEPGRLVVFSGGGANLGKALGIPGTKPARAAPDGAGAGGALED